MGADSAYDAAAKIGLSLDTVTDAATGNASALAIVQEKLAEIQAMDGGEKEAAFGENWVLAEASAKRVAEAVKGESSSIEEAIRVAKQKESVDGDTAASNALVEDSYAGVTEAVDTVVTSVVDLAAELDALNGKNLDAREAARQLEEAYDSFDATLKENGPTLNQFGTDLDLTTEKGRQNQAALDGIAGAALAAGQSIVDSGGSYADYQASLNGSREALLVRINDLGITGQAAQDLADKILSIPAEKDFAIYAETATAAARLQKIQDLINGIGKTMSLHVSTGPGSGGITQSEGSVMSFYANGGLTERHVAQIERAGAMRVWAEPETGGEAYIPMSPAKRGRSTAILEDVAGQFGYQLVPVGSQSFADGGRTGPRRSGASARGGDRIYNIYETYDAQATALSVARIENDWGAV
ncbi:hypothetical protein E3T28_15940 [Cryobacterium sinapicolor]|uniref:Uncharacterized protein n=1 Tax=Cryobacterium sinapicolor TaxID=1259236 RepID=A0ABY2IVP7_9MICO|nr:hypothetical protein [Cryobacterium sinapicolor]TFC94046.1 hypothetical protein E3T28_15940 [Cryobacterium sinapicolor]